MTNYNITHLNRLVDGSLQSLSETCKTGRRVDEGTLLVHGVVGGPPGPHLGAPTCKQEYWQYCKSLIDNRSLWQKHRNFFYHEWRCFGQGEWYLPPGDQVVSESTFFWPSWSVKNQCDCQKVLQKQTYNVEIMRRTERSWDLDNIANIESPSLKMTEQGLGQICFHPVHRIVQNHRPLVITINDGLDLNRKKNNIYKSTSM